MPRKNPHELQREQEINDIKSVLETDYGKRLLMRLINRAAVLQPTYANGTHPSDFAFMEGRREFGLFLIGEITQVSSDAWLDMQKEHFQQIQANNEKVKHEREQQRASDND
ncbi:Bbp19 family protein [Acinetobacter sp.]|uniref:Bbp19 family protein n=1 Tax=Acinetobacter sp. TaxID=472 RepID=UPI002FD97CA6